MTRPRRLRKYRPRKRTNLCTHATPFVTYEGRTAAEGLRACDRIIARGDRVGPLLNARRLVAHYYPGVLGDDWRSAIDALIGQAVKVAA